jgi:hypothetical protein
VHHRSLTAGISIASRRRRLLHLGNPLNPCACTFGFGDERRQLLSKGAGDCSANVNFRLAFCRDAR